MRSLPVVVGVCGALSLACGGVSTPLPPECEPISLPAGRLTTPAENAAATPKWAAEFSVAAAHVDYGDPARVVPQLRQPPPASAGSADGGPLRCELDAPSRDGIPTAAIRIPGGTTYRVTFPNAATTFLLPPHQGGGTAHLTASLARTTCTPTTARPT